MEMNTFQPFVCFDRSCYTTSVFLNLFSTRNPFGESKIFAEPLQILGNRDIKNVEFYYIFKDQIF